MIYLNYRMAMPYPNHAVLGFMLIVYYIDWERMFFEL